MDQEDMSAFYTLSVEQRLRVLKARGLLSEAAGTRLLEGSQLSVAQADKMVENVIGVWGLPLGFAPHFLINHRDHGVALVVEEPSVIAALSSAAKRVRKAGGFTVESDPPRLIGQVQMINVRDPAQAQKVIGQHRQALLDLANSLHPNMVSRGGGAQELEVHIHPQTASHQAMVVVHLVVDTCDAMGANVVNTMCEGVAPLLEKLTGDRVFLKIVSNLTDRSMLRAWAVVDAEHLASPGYGGQEVRDGIIAANDFALRDPYRAATHNKGIMNGIDAVALATGNDWRAIEAAAHAYAGRGASYTALTQWSCDGAGRLVGCLEMPLKVGLVGGTVQANPGVALVHRLMGVTSARVLAEIMAAVGLAQNLAALRALATEGIQRGHMRLHARSVAMSAGVPAALFETVVDKLRSSDAIKVWKAQEISASLQKPASDLKMHSAKDLPPLTGVGHGKVVLLGEHAVVYGSHALAAPLRGAVQARVEESSQQGVALCIPAWGVDMRLEDPHPSSLILQQSLRLILTSLDVQAEAMTIQVQSALPRAMGLGGSAAVAVAVIRALSLHHRLHLSDDAVNGLAFEVEKLAHGTPSGVDNTVATGGQFILFKAGPPVFVEPVSLHQPVEVVIGLSGVESLTAQMVAQVRRARRNHSALYARLFQEIDQITLEGHRALQHSNFKLLGELMNVNHGLLHALGASSCALDLLVDIARRHGAWGAKLTGGGGGGAMVALCPKNSQKVVDALQKAGYQAMRMQLGGAHVGGFEGGDG